MTNNLRVSYRGDRQKKKHLKKKERTFAKMRRRSARANGITKFNRRPLRDRELGYNHTRNICIKKKLADCDTL